MRAHLRTAIVALLGIILLALFLRNANLREVWAEVTRARMGVLLLSVVLTAMTYVFRAMRWQYLLSPIGRVSLANALRMTIIGFAASAVLPARAGEVLRPWLLARKEGLSATAAFATIILERVLDTVMVLLLFGLFLLLAEPDFARGDPLAFSRLKIGGGLAALVSVLALAAMFFLAGHPGTLNSLQAGFERALPVAACGGWHTVPADLCERTRHRAAARPACGRPAAIGPALALDRDRHLVRLTGLPHRPSVHGLLSRDGPARGRGGGADARGRGWVPLLLPAGRHKLLCGAQ